jgi:hypothetical protein
MDYFTKNKLLFWCVIILIAVNAVTLTSFWLRKPPFPPPGGHDVRLDGQKIMEEQLQLSDEQSRLFEKIRNEHFRRTRPLQDDAHKIRLDILDEIFASEPDQTRIQNLLAELSDKQNQFEKYLFAHFQELKKACDEGQAKELKAMLIDLMGKNRPHDPRRHPPGSAGEFGPDRKPPPRR